MAAAAPSAYFTSVCALITWRSLATAALCLFYFIFLISCLNTKSGSGSLHAAPSSLPPPLLHPLLPLLCLSSSGAMWPGIKTETGLPEAPSGGQPGFLSFSTAYTSTQPGHLHYSYPSQGKLQPHPVSPDNAVTHSLPTPAPFPSLSSSATSHYCAEKSDSFISFFCFFLSFFLMWHCFFQVELFLSPGSSFTTSSVYSSIPSATAATTTSTTMAPQVGEITH